MGVKYLITGGAGFIGSHITDRLAESGNKVSVIDNLCLGRRENVNLSAAFYKYDILSANIEKVFKKEKPEVVFHFAAHIEARESVKDPVFDARVNILGSLNILENCRKFKVKKIIFASSGGEIYGDASVIPTPESYEPSPISPYGVAKLAVEKYLNSYFKIHGISFASMRYGNVYGPRQNPNGEAGAVAIFASKMLKGTQPFIHGDGRQTKDYIFIDDAVDATLQLSKKNINGFFNVAGGKEASVLEIFNKLKKLTGSKVKARHIAFPKSGFSRGSLSIKKVHKIIKWQPKYNLDKGLSLTVDWFKKHG